jgi:hypothetical protein
LHGEQFGTRCDRCHSTTEWLPAQLIKHQFDRMHAGDDLIPCETCHIDNYVAYTCTECHEHDDAIVFDQHPGIEHEVLMSCAQCHPTGLPSDLMPVVVLQQ